LKIEFKQLVCTPVTWVACSNSEDDETAYEEQPVPDTVRVLFQPSAAHADFLIDPIWTVRVSA